MQFLSTQDINFQEKYENLMKKLLDIVYFLISKLYRYYFE